MEKTNQIWPILIKKLWFWERSIFFLSSLLLLTHIPAVLKVPLPFPEKFIQVILNMNVHILEKSPSRYVLNEKGVSKLTLLLPYFCKFLLYPQQENQKIKTKLKPKKKKNPPKIPRTNKQNKMFWSFKRRVKKR